MGSAESIKYIAQIVTKNHQEGVEIVLACSAMNSVTDMLIKMGQLAQQRKENDALKYYINIRQKHLETANALGIGEQFEEKSRALFQDMQNLIRGIGLIREFSERSTAYLLSFGERLSTRLLVLFLIKKGLPAEQFDSNFIKTRGQNFTEDEVQWDETKNAVKAHLEPCIKRKGIPVVTGFFGTNQPGAISLLGRGGSDFSAAILAVSLGIKSLEIWTDVDGFLSADPRIVANARIIDEIGFQEASELCFFGAKVLHPKTIKPVIKRGGEVWIKNTFSPEQQGTRITHKAKETAHTVISISSKKVGMISLDQFATQKSKRTILSELFSLAEREKLYIDMIAASEAEVSFCIEEKHLEKTDFFDAFEKICPFHIKKNRSILCIVSPYNNKGQIGIAGRIFSSLAESGINVEMYSQNASEIAQLIVIHSKQEKNAIKNLHKKLIDSGF